MLVLIEPWNSTMLRSVLFAVSTGWLALAGFPAHAGPLLDFTGGGEYFVAEESTLGWDFMVTSPIEVDALGIFDVGADGLADDHALGLWTGSGTLLRAVVITNANGTPVNSTSPNGNWRTVVVPALTLPVGTYVLGATYMSGSADHLFEGAAGLSVPDLTFGTAKSSLGSGLLFPATDQPNVEPGYYGPDLFSIAAIPEPSSLFVFGAAMIGLASRVAGKRGKKTKAFPASAGCP